jgi:hypothetical protein
MCNTAQRGLGPREEEKSVMFLKVGIIKTY